MSMKDRAKEILRTWDKEDLIEDALIGMNEEEIALFVKDNEDDDFPQNNSGRTFI